MTDELYLQIKQAVLNSPFDLPIVASKDIDYKKALRVQLQSFLDYYVHNLRSLIMEAIPAKAKQKPDYLLNNITKLVNDLSKCLELHMSGKLKSALELFYEMMNFLSKLAITAIYPEKTSFYRGRIQENGRHFSARDVFHVPYEYRHNIPTQRYSILGFPAIYMGDTTYVCWEELNRHPFREIWFTRLESEIPMEFIEIIRKEDFFERLEERDRSNDEKAHYILRFLVTFPLSLASAFSTQNPEGKFKPEYIIPQMLLQYVAETEVAKGIRYPSTRVCYKLLNKVPAYNYVIPVKSMIDKGLCPILTNTFRITEPTSLEIEEVLPPLESIEFGTTNGVTSKSTMSLVNDEGRYYHNTSFYRIEARLNKKTAVVLPCNQ